MLKVAAKTVHSAQYTVLNFAAAVIIKKEFYETLANIRELKPATV